MKLIVLSSVIEDKHRELIDKTAREAGAKVCYVTSEAEIPSDFSDAEVLYGFGMETAKKSKSLKWLCVPSAGVDYLMKPGTFANEDCILTNSAGAYGVTIAEHMIAVSLMMMRGLDRAYKNSLNGFWDLNRPAQKSLKDCRITVLGTGDIGTSFAVRAKAFEPRSLVGICRSGKASSVYDSVHKIDALDAILPSTDLLAMSLPDTPETRDILSAERIALMPSGSYIVNVGRGSAIDEDALSEALGTGHIAGAALDVFKTEPLPSDSPLWNTKNLLITPHVAGNLTLEHTLDKNVSMFCEDLLLYASGQPLKHVVDRKKGY